MDSKEVFKIISVLSLASLIGYFIFNSKYLLWIALILNILNIFENRIAFFIANLWMKFARFIGNLNSKILLTLLFFIILTPWAILYRTFNKKLVNHFKSNDKESYLEDVNPGYKKDAFEKMW